MKIKRCIFPVLLLCMALVLMVLLPNQVSAATEGVYTYSVSGGKVTITDCNTAVSGDLVIPSTLGGYPVTEISDRAFYGCSNLTSVTIPEGVTSIGTRTFDNCSSLTSITIPDSVTSIGSYAFEDCSSLESLTIPDSVTSIGDSAFSHCSSLPSVTIPDSVTSIGYDAFYNCSSLTSVTILEGVTSIGYDAFRNCSSLTSITIPDSVTSIGSGAFYNCRSLTAVTIGDSVTSIDSHAFYNCSSLESVTIPEGITSIGVYAFSYCSSLTSVTIPDSVTSIGDLAFNYCSSLKEVHISDVSAWCKINFADTYSNPLSYAENLYVHGAPVTEVVIEEGVTKIPVRAFYGCSSLTSVTIPEGVTSIGDSAFRNCSGLESVTIPEGVTSIGDSAFSHCSSLTSVTIPDSVTSIGNSAFCVCSSLTSITIPDSVTSIGVGAFQYCSKLATVYYCGTTETKKAIEIGTNNQPLTNIDWQYHAWAAVENTTNKVCIYCGNEAPYWQEMTGIRRAESLSLEGVVYINAIVGFVDAQGKNVALDRQLVEENAKILFWNAVDMPELMDDAVLGTQTSISGVKFTEVYGGIAEYKGTSHGIAAKFWGDRVYYRTYIEIDGEPFYGVINSYSVKQYCEKQIPKTGASYAKMRPLLATMLNYGAAAQVNWKYNTDALANARLPEFVEAGYLDASVLQQNWDAGLLDPVTQASADMKVNFPENEITCTARSLSLEGAVVANITMAYQCTEEWGEQIPEDADIKFYFWDGRTYDALAAAGTPLSKENATYVVGKENITQKYDEDRYGYEYTASSKGIPAKQLGESLYVTMVVTLADGTEYCNGVYAYSPEVYAKNQLSKGSVKEATKDVIRWMVLYGEAAKAYFGQ